MKLRKILLSALVIAPSGIHAMDEPESWNCEFFSFAQQLLKDALISIRFNCDRADASQKLFTEIKNKNYTAVATILSEHPTLIDAAEDTDGVTPLLAATMMGDDALVAQLLNRQPQVDRCTHQGFAMINKNGKSNFIPIAGFTPLMAAAKFNYENIAKQLLGAKASKDLKDFSRPGKTALDYAKEGGNTKMVSLLS